MFSYCLSALYSVNCVRIQGLVVTQTMDSGGATYYVEEVVGGRSLCFYACFLMFGIGMKCFILRCVHPCFQVGSSSRIQSLKRQIHFLHALDPVFRSASG